MPDLPTLKPPLSAAETAEAKHTVCVTGAAGYVAAHIVHRLLLSGHTVHGTVRNKSKASHLTKLPGNPLTLQAACQAGRRLYPYYVVQH